MTILHQIGDQIREWMIAIPMPVARGLFVLFPLLLLMWVLRLPAESVRPPREKGSPKRSGANLKLWAAIALVFQVVIYLVF